MDVKASPANGDLHGDMDRSPLRPRHIYVVSVCALALFLDLAEYGIGAVLSVIFSAPPYSMDATVLSWVLAAVYLGTVVGAVAAGWMADRFGRRPVILAALIMMVVTSLAAAASPNTWTLIVSRGLSGIALGAYPPLMVAYLTDVLPARFRAPLIMTVVAFGALGQVAAIFLIRSLMLSQPLGIDAWRWAYVVGAAVALLCLTLFLLAPESPRWLAAKGRIDDAWRAWRAFGSETDIPPAALPVSTDERPALLEGRVFFRRLAFLALIFLLAPVPTVGFSLLSGAVLMSKGIGILDSLFYLGIYGLGATIGAISFAAFADMVSRKAVLLSSSAIMLVLQFLFSWVDSGFSIILIGTLFNVTIAIVLPTLVLYAAEMVPTPQRGRSTAWSWAARGVGSTLAPVVLIPLLHFGGAFAFSAAIGAALAIFMVLVATFGPRGAAGQDIR